MTSPSNLDFQTPGSTPGSALGWTATATCSATGFGSYQSTNSGRRRRAEWFSSGWPADTTAISFTSNGTSVLASGGHPFTSDDVDDGQTVVLTGGVPPSPLKALAILPTHGEPDLSYVYFIVTVVAGVSFGLSATPRGTPIAVASGSGAVCRPGVEFYLTRLPSEAKVAGVFDHLTAPTTVEMFNRFPEYRFNGRLGSDLAAGVYNVTISPPYAGDGVDMFNRGWFNNQDQYRFTGRLPGDLAGDGNAEDFTLWHASLADYRFSGRVNGDTVRATVDAVTSTREMFLACIDTTWIPTVGTTTCTCPVEPPSVGAGVVVSVDAGGTLPSPMVDGETWFVVARNSAAKTFTLSDTKGGAAHNFGVVGTGTFRITADLAYAWNATGP